MLALIWRPGYPAGADTWGHLFRAEYLAGRMHEEGLGAYFRSAWLPAWYMGDLYRTYYPPLTVLLLGPLLYLLHSPFLAYRLFLSLLLVLYAHLTYATLCRGATHGPWSAALSAALALWAPYTIRTLFVEGNLPRALAVLAVPIIAWLTEEALTREGLPWIRSLVLSAAWGWAILGHPQQAYVFAIGFGLYSVLRTLLDEEVRVTRLLWTAVPVALGAALVAPWLLPAYSHRELANVPYLSPAKAEMEQFSAMLRSFGPAIGVRPGDIVFGTGLTSMAVLAAFVRPHPLRTAWLFSGLLCLWLSLGAKGNLFALVPGHGLLLPERFANFAAFALPVAAGGLVPLTRRRALTVIFLAGLIALDTVPSLPVLSRRIHPGDRPAIPLLLAEEPRGGRVALMIYREPTALDMYFACSVAGRDQVSGWALEATPHHAALRRLLTAPRWGAEYFARLLSLWNVQQVLLSGTEVPAADVRRALAQAGFAFKAQKARFELWVSERPPRPLQRLPKKQMLVVGSQADPLFASYPFATEGSLPELADYAAGQLDAYPVLGLMRFSQEARRLSEAEVQLRQWVSPGRTAVVELSGMEQLFPRGRAFLGVTAAPLSVRRALEVRWSGPLQGQPAQLSLEGLPESPEWGGVAYRNLDRVLAEIEQDGERFALLGYKEVGRGRVWFVGLNLLYYAQLARLQDLSKAIADLTLAGTDVERRLDLEPILTRSVRFEDGRLEVFYEIDRPVDAMLSFTYSPRWRAEVDGVRVPIGEYEHLIRLLLPAGTRRLVVTYDSYATPWPRAGLLVGVVSLASLWVLTLWEGGKRRARS